jgi:hypothetical protein
MGELLDDLDDTIGAGQVTHAIAHGGGAREVARFGEGLLHGGAHRFRGESLALDDRTEGKLAGYRHDAPEVLAAHGLGVLGLVARHGQHGLGVPARAASMQVL